jgi:hypothetical protein
MAAATQCRCGDRMKFRTILGIGEIGVCEHCDAHCVIRNCHRCERMRRVVKKD